MTRKKKKKQKEIGSDRDGRVSFLITFSSLFDISLMSSQFFVPPGKLCLSCDLAARELIVYSIISFFHTYSRVSPRKHTHTHTQIRAYSYTKVSEFLMWAAGFDNGRRAVLRIGWRYFIVNAGHASYVLAWENPGEWYIKWYIKRKIKRVAMRARIFPRRK